MIHHKLRNGPRLMVAALLIEQGGCIAGTGIQNQQRPAAIPGQCFNSVQSLAGYTLPPVSGVHHQLFDISPVQPVFLPAKGYLNRTGYLFLVQSYQ